MTPNKDIIKEFCRWLEEEDRQNWEIERYFEDLLEQKDREWSSVVDGNLNEIYCSAKHIIEEAEELSSHLEFETNNDEIEKILEPLNNLTNPNKKKE